MTVIMPKLAERKDCTGCAACYAACSFDALQMIADDEGFLRPSVDVNTCCECGECTKRCPVVTYPELVRFTYPDIYAVRASDDIREFASSGGVFPLLAKWMLSQGGMVAGAVIGYADGLRVKHVVSDDEAIVREMSSSKYVQSKITSSLYTDIESALKDGRDVLFSGCPCQVAGIYAYFADSKYDGILYTMDFFCHGVPSPAIYEKYLRERFGDRLSEIERFDFRDKSVFGWSTCINAYFKDGTEEHIHMDNDPYYQMFLPCAIQRPSCSVCMFSSFPRRADISVGDFWGCENYDVELNDGMGTSFALVNSELGKEMLSGIKPGISHLSENVPLEAILPVNPTPIRPFEPHSGREHIFRFREAFDVGKLADHGLHARYDVGIVSKWYTDDLSALSTYALVKMIERDGHDTVVIEKPGYIMRDEELYDDSRAARRLIRENCFVTSRRGVSWQEMEYNEICGRFVFLTDAPMQERAFASRAEMDEREYFAGRFVSPTKAKKMLDEAPMWMPVLALRRDEYEELVAKACERIAESNGMIELDPITALIADILDDSHGAEEKEYAGEEILPVLVSLACGKPFSYTGNDTQLLDLLVSLGTVEKEDGAGVSVAGTQDNIQKRLNEVCRAYEADLFEFLDTPHEYDGNASFLSEVMSETLEAHRKSDALRERVEELERIVGTIDATTPKRDGAVGKGMRYLREYGMRSTAMKTIGRLLDEKGNAEVVRRAASKNYLTSSKAIPRNGSATTTKRSIIQKARNVLRDVAYMNLARFKNERKHSGRSRITKQKNTLSDDEKTYDVGIVGLWYGKNYGSILTYYALYQLVEQLGYRAVMLDKPPALWDDSFNDPEEIAQRFIRSHCNIAERCESMLGERNMNSVVDSFLLGSDVVWNYEICGQDAGHFFFLDYVDGSKKKIAFASSLGSGLDDAPDEYKRIAAAYLRDFDYLSVREKSALDALQDRFHVSTDHVLDPVLLVPIDVFDQIAVKGERNTDIPYFMSYVLGPNENKKAVQDYLEVALCLSPVTYKNPNDDMGIYRKVGYNVAQDVDIEDWVRCIRDCSFFLGDSFHGLCFSLIFERPFIICVKQDIAGLTRFESLLEECGLLDRLVFEDDPNCENKIDELLKTDIDWDDVHARLEPHIECSKEWLKTALSGKKRSVWQKHAR